MISLEDYKKETKGKACVARYKSATINYEDWWISSTSFVRYTWTNVEEGIERNVLQIDADDEEY